MIQRWNQVILKESLSGRIGRNTKEMLIGDPGFREWSLPSARFILIFGRPVMSCSILDIVALVGPSLYASGSIHPTHEY